MNRLGVLIAVSDLKLRRFAIEAVESCEALRLLVTASNWTNAIRKLEDDRPDLVVVAARDYDLVEKARLRDFLSTRVPSCAAIDISGSAPEDDGRADTQRDRRLIPRLFIEDLHAEGTRFQFVETLLALRPQQPRTFGGDNAEDERHRRRERIELVAIGASTGGPDALARVLGDLPATFRAPILVTQHIPGDFVESLVERLDRSSPFQVSVAAQGVAIQPGHVYVAPGDHHLTLGPVGHLSLELSDAAPEQSCRPAVDPMFRSCARLGMQALGVVLTGMGQDGLEGARQLHEAGGSIIVQNETSSAVWGMPGAIAKAGLAHEILPLEEIGAALAARVGVFVAAR